MLEIVLQNFESLRPRILVAIISEIFMLLVCISIGINIYRRYSKKKITQTLYLSYTYLFYSASILSSIIGKVLHYFYTYDINLTESGIFSNWSMSLTLMVAAIYYQFLFNYEIYPPKNKRTMIILHRWIIMIIGFLILGIPRYFMGNELEYSNPIKFALVFSYVSWACIYYIVFSFKIYSFSEIEPLIIRVKYSSLMYTCEMLYFVINVISQIYGTITGVFYGFFYYLSLFDLVFLFIFGYLGTKSYSQDDINKIKEIMKREKIV